MLFERGKYLIETVETTISMFDRKPYQNIVPFCSRVGNEISRRLAYNLTRQVLRFNSITQLQMFASGLMQPIFANGTDKTRRNIALSLVFGMFFARATPPPSPTPCFARYFILAIAVNLVQDQIWLSSSRTFRVQFESR